MNDTINLFEIVGDFGEDKDMAAALWERRVKPALLKGEVILNFTGVTLVTQSFVHALISDVLRTFGEEALDKIQFNGCSPGVQGIIETVVQ